MSIRIDPLQLAPAWLEWSTEAFSRAHALGRPVLLSIVTAWSAACHELDRSIGGAPDLVELIAREFVPVRVDACRRPDIAERYTLGGWPTTALLTPAGALLAGTTSTVPERLQPMLEGVARAFRERRQELQRLRPAVSDAPQPLRGSSPDADAPERLLLMARRGDGALDLSSLAGASAPRAVVLRALMRSLARWNDEPIAARVAAAVDELVCGPAWDAERGGFSRSAGPDASVPDRTKLAVIQAELLDTVLDGAIVFACSSHMNRAREIVDFLLSSMTAPPGVFFASPAQPALWYVDVNARIVRACLRAAQVLDDERLLVRAVDVLERVVPAAYERAAGMAHYLDPRPRVRGLLVDQVETSAALLAAAAATDRRAYRDLAEELMRTALTRLWDSGAASFVDRVRVLAGAGDVGLLAEPLRPLDTNADAAVVLARLARMTEDRHLYDRALDILSAFGGCWHAEGLHGAPYVLALLEVTSAGEGQLAVRGAPGPRGSVW